MRAIFRICGNESEPSLQLVEKLVTLLRTAELVDAWKGMKFHWVAFVLPACYRYRLHLRFAYTRTMVVTPAII